jgi:hypothetical protein
MTPIFVSFYTPAYAPHADKLISSLEAFGLPYDVRRVESSGNWVSNCSRKAPFLLDMLAAHPGKPLVWLDADATVEKRPDLFDTLDCDFAAHWRYGAELLSGTLYFNATAAARRLLEAWHRQCALHPKQWDQVTLQGVIDRGVDRLRVERLPASYTCIFDGNMSDDPVISHWQASRVLSRTGG